MAAPRPKYDLYKVAGRCSGCYRVHVKRRPMLPIPKHVEDCRKACGGSVKYRSVSWKEYVFFMSQSSVVYVEIGNVQ